MTLRKYFNIFRASLVERMAYRGDFLLGTVLRFLPVMTTILLWEAVFAGSGQEELAGFTRRQMIAYLLLIHISRMFSSMPGLAGGISRDIRDGSLKKYLIQPLNMIGYLLYWGVLRRRTSPRPPCSTPGCSWSVAATSMASRRLDHARLPCVPASGLPHWLFSSRRAWAWSASDPEVTSLLWVINTLNYFISDR
jgi:hypothetical protein